MTAVQTQVKAVRLTAQGVVLLDQTQLPHCVAYQTIQTPQAMVTAIRDMIVRGAPAIGISGAMGVVLSVRQQLAQGATSLASVLPHIQMDCEALRQARPTAVNLQWAVDRMETHLKTLHAQTDTLVEILTALEAEAQAILDEDIAMCQAMGRHGASLAPKGARILTHCNAGALATGGYGTALGVIRSAYAQDPSVTVYADETRPRLQGAKLTTWEMVQEGIPVTLISDNMSAWLMKQGRVDMVVVGADRIAANGDTANKIGTYSTAVNAKHHGVKFMVVAPVSTIDMSLADGSAIPIEQRPEGEVLGFAGHRVAAEGANAWNPSFDVTPAELIDAIVTERGVVQNPTRERMGALIAR